MQRTVFIDCGPFSTRAAAALIIDSPQRIDTCCRHVEAEVNLRPPLAVVGLSHDDILAGANRSRQVRVGHPEVALATKSTHHDCRYRGGWRTTYHIREVVGFADHDDPHSSVGLRGGPKIGIS